MPLLKVFEPIMVGPVELPNRVVRTAHGTDLVVAGRFTDDFIAYHAARARGGCGLSILEAAAIHPSTRLFEFGLFHDTLVGDYQRLMAACRPAGMKVFQQLWHGGNLYPRYDGGPGWAVSDIPGMQGFVGLKMSDGMIWELIEAYAACAVRARDGGLDGVEVHAAHGYLPQQFLSPVCNDRTDQWGGSFDNRIRFLKETLKAIRAAVGRDIAVGVRLSASEMPGGISEEDNKQVIRALEAENLIDIVNVSRGDYYLIDTMLGSMHKPTAYEVPSSGDIASVATVPRLIAGRFRTLEDVDQVIRDGVADLVSMVRAHIADPDLVRKTREGRALEVRPCIGCNQHSRAGRFGCTVNAAVGADASLQEDLIVPTTAPKKVLVVGGGAAGMEAARVAALKGHKVVLCEASPSLGGMLNVARRAPKSANFGDIAVWLEQEVYRLGVEVRLNTYVETSDIEAENPDHLIIATGSAPRMDGLQHTFPAQKVAGVDQAHVVSSTEALTERRDWGKSAVVLDTVGDYEALAVAEQLLTEGLKVTYVTPEPAMAWKSERAWPAFERFLQLGEFDTKTRHHLVEVQKDQVLLRPRLGGTQQITTAPADTVVLVTQNQPLRQLYEELRDTRANLHLVGDANQPRDLMSAVREGHRAARGID
ncbi:MAG: FAD-dependent oxidoreductase [Caulobacteraceae bacterium]|nr:FAD-dependent oxidoreductase [Caulobacteraceae bacterium]